MFIRHLPSCLALLLALFLASGSFVSAGMMAPERGQTRIEALELALGTAADDICGNERKLHHHCPFCHGLPGAPQVTLKGAELKLSLHPAWRRLTELERRAQARNPHHTARAPPLTC